MSRHEFQPGRLIAGAVLVTGGALFLADASGEADLPWWAMPPLVVGGLALAAVAGIVTMLRRSRRRERAKEGAAGTGSTGSGATGAGAGSGAAAD
ncbi:hypothetical protein JNUCC64_21545 [Streptomyces sp. JNUCC 64]